MMSFKFPPFELYDEEHNVVVLQVRHHSNIGVGILLFYVYDWLFLQNEWLLLPWSLVAMATLAFYEYEVPQ